MTEQNDSAFEGAAATPEPAPEESLGASPESAADAVPASPAPSETDRLAAQVTGPEDQVGMAALWRLTMGLDHWWFIAVGDEGAESPAAAEIDGQLMLLTFTTSERARDFAVKQEMIGPADDLNAIALPPAEVVQSSAAYSSAGIHGLMFDPHISGFFIPSEQLPIVWDAVTSTRASE
ncbi:hypothetical protein [Ornithinimicrobium cavernae]|uniref:hypothetical protein n=1 Tax=Ornithinimicrobium cavernae TaxID=2666047 RepID=UPI000D694CDD|nr:hypothetical protein [Ornithinimicrobium cavernae]